MDIPILKKRIEPKPGCALFFPSRKKEDRVVVGTPTMIRLWPQEEFKQIQLGDFWITTAFGPNSPKPSAKTLDNLPCKAQVEFRCGVIETDEALEKATRTNSVSKNLKDVISHESFKRELQGDLETIVEEVIRTFKYLDLLKNPELAGKVEESIRANTHSKAGEKGFELRGCRADVEIVRLDDETLAQNATLKEYRIEAETQKKVLENSLKKVELDHQLAKERKESSFQVDKDDLVKERDKKIRAHTITEEEDKLEKKRTSIEIQRSIQELDAKVQKEKLEYEQEIETLKIVLRLDREEEEQVRRYKQEKEELVRQADLAEMRRLEEAKEKQSELEHLRYEIELDQLKVKRAELQGEIAKKESERMEVFGKAQAEIDREKALAVHAHTMRMNESLLTALPGILEKAYAPTEKLGEVKVLYLGGRNFDSSGEYQAPTDQALGTILSSMSTLPMVKEVLRFLGSWESQEADKREREQNRVSAHGPNNSRGVKAVNYGDEADKILTNESE
ncbi:MAG TPA: flotillin domain-containing protein [Pyrinomonadaceae bacterium]